MATNNSTNNVPLTYYLELNQNSTQSISANTQTAVQFPNSVKNTFSSALTISGTGNTTFTNASGKDMFLTIHSSLAVDNSSASATALWLSILPSRAIGNVTVPVVSLNDTNFTKVLPDSVCAPLFLANGDSFQIVCSTNGNTTLGNSASVNSQVWRTCLIVSGVIQ